MGACRLRKGACPLGKLGVQGSGFTFGVDPLP